MSKGFLSSSAVRMSVVIGLSLFVSTGLNAAPASPLAPIVQAGSTSATGDCGRLCCATQSGACGSCSKVASPSITDKTCCKTDSSSMQSWLITFSNSIGAFRQNLEVPAISLAKMSFPVLLIFWIFSLSMAMPRELRLRQS